MTNVTVPLEEELIDHLPQPVSGAVREVVIFELFRRGELSSGRCAKLLGIGRMAFIERASRLGIPFFEMDAEEWESEKKTWGIV